MGTRSKKTIWTDFEKDTIYSKVVAILKDKPKTKFIEAVRLAQIALPENRHRNMAGPSQIPPDLRDRFIQNNVLPRNWKEGTRGSKKQKEFVPIEQLTTLEEQMQELQGELSTANVSLQQAGQLIDELKVRVADLENQPTPAQAIQRFVAETLAMALDMHEARGKPAALRVLGGHSTPDPKSQPRNGEPSSSGVERRRETLPDFERERRKDPTPTQGLPSGKPRIALIADFVGADKALIHQGASGKADLRYLDSNTKFQGLKQFVANAGRIILWADHSPHDWEGALQNLGVSFHRHRGSLTALIEHVKVTADKMTKFTA